MQVTPESVRREREWFRERGTVVVPLINDVRDALADQFDVAVDHVDDDQYGRAVDDVFADGDLAVNVTALAALLRELDVTDDYPGVVVDELLGRELAGMLAGGQPLELLAQATFHYADVHTNYADGHTEGGGDGEPPAGADDLDAALAAGFQTQLPGWPWRETASPFSVSPDL